MALTRLQQRLRREAEELSVMAKLDFWNIEKQDEEARTPLLRLAISYFVVGAIVTEYTLLDEILSTLICRYYFKRRRKAFINWRQKKFRTFVQYVLDEMYLMKKMEIVHPLSRCPKRCVRLYGR